MEKQISFIHAADLHLDSPFSGLAHLPESIFQAVRESTFQALERLVTTAIDRQVDFVLIVGDLFDNERQSLKAQIKLRDAFEKLKKHEINVYVSYGNHDHINGNIHPVTYPDNVFIFSSEQVRSFIFTKNNKEIAEIAGFSYENRAVTENKVNEYKIKNKSIAFHIAMLHGSLQSNTDHDTYAPFQLNELSEKEFNYWALGHIHKRAILKEEPFIIYPGNIQGRNRKETGEKGCFHVVMSEEETEIDFVPLQAIQYIPLMVDVSICEEAHQIEEVIQKKIGSLNTTTPTLIDLTLYSEQDNLMNWESDQLLDEVIEIINESYVDLSHWNYIFRYTTNIERATWEGLDKDKDHFIGELAKQFDGGSISPYLTPLFNHQQGRKYLTSIMQEEEEDIKLEAQKLLINALLKEGV